MIISIEDLSHAVLGSTLTPAALRLELMAASRVYTLSFLIESSRTLNNGRFAEVSKEY